MAWKIVCGRNRLDQVPSDPPGRAAKHEFLGKTEKAKEIHS